jgi:hypothetical protein
LGILHHRGKKSLQQSFSIPIEYDYGDFQNGGKLTAKFRNIL